MAAKPVTGRHNRDSQNGQFDGDLCLHTIGKSRLWSGQLFEFRDRAVKFIEKRRIPVCAERSDQTPVVPERPLATTIELSETGRALLTKIGEDRARVMQLVTGGNEPYGGR